MKYLIALSILFSFSAFSQQEPISGMYWNNYSYFNPAMSGVKFKHEANVTYRSQWSKVIGPPTTWYANYSTRLKETHGIGVNYNFDAIGFNNNHRAKVNYNYQVTLQVDKKLIFGTALSFSGIRWHPNWDYADWIYVAPQNTVLFDLGAAYYGKQITAGLSATQLPIYRSSTHFTYAPHLFGNFRYQMPFMGSNQLIFETQFRTDLAKYTQDFNVGYNHKNVFEVGVGYRTSDAVLINLTGIIAEKYRVGYAYALTINQMSNFSRSTHEIVVGLRIPN